MTLTVNNDLFPQTALACCSWCTDYCQLCRECSFTGLEHADWVSLVELLIQVPTLCRVTRSQGCGWSRSLDLGCVKPSTCTETRVRARTRVQAHVVRAHLDGDAVCIVMWELNFVRISVIWNMTPCSLVQAYGRFGGTCRFHLSRRILGCKWLRL